jgi:hypothetical protein
MITEPFSHNPYFGIASRFGRVFYSVQSQLYESSLIHLAAVNNNLRLNGIIHSLQAVLSIIKSAELLVISLFSI